MDFELGDPFDGASPGASRLQESDTFDDLLGVQIQSGDFDVSMPDFKEQYVQSSPKAPTANMTVVSQDLNPVATDVHQEIMIKNEPLDEPFTSGVPINTIENPIEISDTEDDNNDLFVVQADGTSIPIKKENSDEVEFIWEKMPDDPIELDPEDGLSSAPMLKPGKSFLKGLDLRAKRMHIDPSAALRAQQAYIQTLQRNNRIPQPSANQKLNNGFGLQGPKSSEPSLNDESAWMEASFTPDGDTGDAFRALKKNYHAKVRTESNTFEEDVEFRKAERDEKFRRARLEAAYKDACGYSDDCDDCDSDDGLFVSAGTKRQANDETSAGGKNRSPKQRKANVSFDRDQELNLLAGIEDYLQRGKKGKGKGGKMDSQKKTKRRAKAGYLSNSNSLLTSNVYEDADANMGRDALPISGHTNKREALAALVASVPLGTTEKDAIAEKNHIKRATETLGRKIKGHCMPDGKGLWKLPGMKSSLHHHQVQGAAFMVDRETAGEEPLGGILADGMGLGKTIMTIALLLANPPPPNEKHKATLIVCTPGLLLQWEREIEKHTEAGHLDGVLKHHSINRVTGKAAVYTLESLDVILTTYPEVVKSYPKLDVPDDISGEDALKAWWEKRWNQERDVLHRARFYRVVLDEAQVIKNHQSQTSKACRALMAKFRWVSSATPIMNHTSELYPYFKFLRVPYSGSFNDFCERYCKVGNDDCNSRLHCLLDQIMCRRTMRTEILGAPIIKLPKHNQRTMNVAFSPVENAIYKRVVRKFVGILNKASADGTLEKHPGVGLVAFLRLRQMCAHTFLVQDVLEELLDIESIDEMQQELVCGATSENENDRNILAALRRMIESKPEVVEAPEESEQVEPGKLAAQFGSFLKSLKAKGKWVELKDRTQCHFCGEPPESPCVTSCLHVYCQECLQALANRASENDQDQTACQECGVIYTSAEPCDGLKELSWDDNWLLNAIGHKKRSNEVNLDWVFYEDRLVMSAKITAVKTQVEKWLEEDPGKKIIIFSQFHMIMQILEKVCQKKQWRYCSYHGKISHKARDKLIKEFTDDADMKIMIASLKCGGVGLNLTMASKVICIDLWYNSCVEQQAFCRVFRMGQESETFITRFIIKQSADSKLMDMQLKKNALIARAMDDKSVMSKLTVNDILRLFGEIRLDKDKRPFIHLDDDEKLDNLSKETHQNEGEDP